MKRLAVSLPAPTEEIRPLLNTIVSAISADLPPVLGKMIQIELRTMLYESIQSIESSPNSYQLKAEYPMKIAKFRGLCVPGAPS